MSYHRILKLFVLFVIFSVTIYIFSDEGACYTSLCGDSDNQYEEIQTESKFEGLKSIKELLLKVSMSAVVFSCEKAALQVH